MANYYPIKYPYQVKVCNLDEHMKVLGHSETASGLQDLWKRACKRQTVIAGFYYQGKLVCYHIPEDLKDDEKRFLLMFGGK